MGLAAVSSFRIAERHMTAQTCLLGVDAMFPNSQQPKVWTHVEHNGVAGQSGRRCRYVLQYDWRAGLPSRSTWSEERFHFWPKGGALLHYTGTS